MSTVAHPPATLQLGTFTVQRLGFGAMRLPGTDVWGEPEDPAEARAVLRRVVSLGLNLIDTAWYYGPGVSNRLIAEALHPYPADLVIATKLGGKRLPDKSWAPALRPEELRQGCEEDLRTLKLDALHVVHLRAMGNAPVPFEESLGALVALQKAGKLRHIALSNVSLPQIEAARRTVPVVAVQNLYNVGGGGGRVARTSQALVDDPEAVLDHCTAQGIAFLPFFPLAMGSLGKPHPALQAACERHGATPAQVALAWLLARSPSMLPIPGTRRVAHLEENCAARAVHLGDEEVQALATMAR
ncbi:MAG TPA: aldo/keto reductase [Myxococcota bacterium]|nr:aldo/keto reductase [Myxococcota bacterium]